MIETAPSMQPTFIRRVFYRDTELRAGWRLMIFLALVIGLISAGNLIVSHFLPNAKSVSAFIVREIMDFVIFLIASAIMSKVERRGIGDYGLPRRGMFGVQFWQGIGLGFGAITVLLLGMRSFGAFRAFSTATRHERARRSIMRSARRLAISASTADLSMASCLRMVSSSTSWWRRSSRSLPMSRRRMTWPC